MFCVCSRCLLIHRGREQDGKGWKSEDKRSESVTAGSFLSTVFTCTGCRAVFVLPIPSTVVTAIPSTAHNGSKQPFAEKCLNAVKVWVLAVLLVLNRALSLLSAKLDKKVFAINCVSLPYHFEIFPFILYFGLIWNVILHKLGVDKSGSRRIAICFSLPFRQIIDLPATDKSRSW